VTHVQIGPYGIGDVEFVAAFDIDERKIGLDLSDAIHSDPNCTSRYIDVPNLGVPVSCGPLADGLGQFTETVVELAEEAHTTTFTTVSEILQAAQADVLICYMPVGAITATSGYAEAAVEAGVAFVNCNPEAIATDPNWQRRFYERGIPVLGDDIKSQLGATTLHRTLIDLCTSRGAVIDRTYQLNVGGNTDFLNMLDPQRASSKRASKMSALKSRLNSNTQFGAGPSDYVSYLADHKVAYITVEGRSLLGMPFSIEAKLTVEDSPNSAGVAVDALRAAKLAKDRGIAGPVVEVCPFLFKRPPIPRPDSEAKEMILNFARQDATD